MVTGAYNLHSYNHRSNKKRKNRQNNFSVNSASQNLQMFVTHNVSKPQLSFPDDLMNHFYEMGLTGGYHTTTLIQTIVFLSALSSFITVMRPNRLSGLLAYEVRPPISHVSDWCVWIRAEHLEQKSRTAEPADFVNLQQYTCGRQTHINALTHEALSVPRWFLNPRRNTASLHVSLSFFHF